MRILNVVVQNDSFEYRDNNFVLSYLVDDSVEDPMLNLRAAIREYGKTKQGRLDVAYACGSYNWGDASCTAMDDILTKHGLRYMNADAIDVFVNHDEVLIDDDGDHEEGNMSTGIEEANLATELQCDQNDQAYLVGMKQFVYCGYHFQPIRKLDEGTIDVDQLMKQLVSDQTFGMSTYSWQRFPYSYQDFYAAATAVGARNIDLFRCVENDRVYIPGENELFWIPDHVKTGTEYIEPATTIFDPGVDNQPGK